MKVLLASLLPQPCTFRLTVLKRFSWTTQHVSKRTAARRCKVCVLEARRFDRCTACKTQLNLGGLEAVCTSEASGRFKSVRSSCPSPRLRAGEDFGVILDLKITPGFLLFLISVSTLKYVVSSGVFKRTRKMTKLCHSKTKTSAGRCCHTLL